MGDDDGVYGDTRNWHHWRGRDAASGVGAAQRALAEHDLPLSFAPRTSTPPRPAGRAAPAISSSRTIGAPTVTTGSSSSVAQTSATLAADRPERRRRHLEVLLRHQQQQRHQLPEFVDRRHDRVRHHLGSRVGRRHGSHRQHHLLLPPLRYEHSQHDLRWRQQLTTQDAPTPVAGAASNIGINGAKLSGTVNPNGANVSSTVFRYGISCMPPDWINNCTLASAAPSPGSGALHGLGVGDPERPPVWHDLPLHPLRDEYVTARLAIRTTTPSPRRSNGQHRRCSKRDGRPDRELRRHALGEVKRPDNHRRLRDE